MQKSTHINRQTSCLWPSAVINQTSRERAMPRAGYERERVPLKKLPALVEQREGMFWGLNKTRCPGLLSLAHMLSVAFSHCSSSYLTLQMEARTGQPPSSACLKSSFSTSFNMVWLLVPCRCPNLLISFSAPLYLFALILGRTLPHHPQPTKSSETHTHMGNTNTWLFHSSPVHPL